MYNVDNVKKFESLLLVGCKRNGLDKLIDYIRESDFYSAPASTRFHNCHEGGLLEHTLNVANRLTAKYYEDSIWKERLHDTEYESLLISALLHDICKANYYVAEPKNKKVYSESGTKSDGFGKYDWQTVLGYSVNDKEPYGHGEKSVMIIEQFIELKPVERYAIRWHMGFTEAKENWNTLSAAIRKYPLILALFEADLEATYILEEEN